MKKIIIILCLFHSIVVNSQTIDWSNFSEQTMNGVIFNKMNNYINPDKIVSVHRTSIEQEKIYRCLKKNNEKVPLNKLERKINDLIGKSDSPFIREANMVGNIGIIDSILCKDVKTYQEIADKCITDWTNSGEDNILIGWSQIGEAVTYYNKKNNTVFIFFAFRQ
jgi:hypothetical protein